MKKLKIFSCIVTSLCAFISLFFVISDVHTLLYSIIYIIALTTTSFLIHCIKKDKQLNSTNKKNTSKLLSAITTGIRYFFGGCSIVLVIAWLDDFFRSDTLFLLDICFAYSFAMLAFILLKEINPNNAKKQEQTTFEPITNTDKVKSAATNDKTISESNIDIQEPVSMPIRTTNELTPDVKETSNTLIDNTIATAANKTLPAQSQQAFVSDEERAAKLNEAKDLLMTSLNQLNELMKSKELITVKITHDAPYPPEVLNSMPEDYNSIQVNNDIRILNDCINIMNSTSNLNTFFSRYELAMRIAYTLQMARKSGINANTSITPDYISSLKNSLADHVLEAAYAKELQGIDTLKTPTGKRNRIDKFLSLISEYLDEYEFSDTYVNIIHELTILKQDL